MDKHVQETSISRATTGRITVGRYVLEIGEPSGAMIRAAPRAQQPFIRPRPTPVLLSPRSIRGLFDRQAEVAAVVSALEAGLPVEASGESGVGKTALLRHLAHHPRAASFADGIVYLSGRHQAAVDLAQLIFEAFYEGDPICKPTDAEIRRGLQDKQALVLLDDVRLPPAELEQVLDVAPRCAFVVATRRRCLWGEVRNVALDGLSVQDAVSLLEREIERTLEVGERLAAARICAALEGHPRRILQAASIARERGIQVDGWARHVAPESLVTELMAPIDQIQRRALLALTALPGVPLPVQHVSGIAEVTDIEPALMTLVRRGLVVRSRSRHHLVEGVADRLRRTEDLKPWANRAITYFTAWAERYRRSPDSLLQECEALVAAQQSATDARRWGEALRLGQLLEGALILGARWGAWAITLERSLAAARAMGDRSAEAWALHQLGSRALCLGEPGRGRTLLNQAVNLRESLDDEVGAAASRRNLAFVVAPVSEDPRRAAMFFNRVPALDSLTPKTRNVAAMAITALLCAMLGALAYTVAAGRLSWNSRSAAGVGSPVRSGVERATTGTDVMLPSLPAGAESSEVQHAVPSVSALTAPVGEPSSAPSGQPSPVTDRASILIFTARPGSVAITGRTELCYAVSDALQVRIEPGLGEVAAANTLTCRRVAPRRTTTYQLTAYGRDGQRAREQLVIVVR
jgi:hypothetical protein